MAEARDDSLDQTLAAPAQPLHFQQGYLFADRYEIEQLVGRGGMGAVYRVQDRELGETVALKVLEPGAGEDDEAVERFRREVRLARRVTHSNAARTYDIGVHDGIRFLTMEFVDGDSLRQVIASRERLSVERAVAIGLQMCEGLTAAHDAGVIHRDLKPANVLIDKKGRVVITDFGIARALQGSEDTFRTVGTIGTPAYMAPEQVSGKKVDARCDLYALGLILYEMLTGRQPFQADTPIAAAVARLQSDPPDPRAHASIPDPLADVLLRCLRRDRNERPATVADLARELLPFGPPADASASQLDLAAAGSGMVATATPTPPSGSGSTRFPTFAPTSPGDRALAVLPFRYRGPPDEEYLAEGLTDELIDLLSMTRGLRVSGHGAVAKYKGERDPREVGRDLNVDAIVEGALQYSPGRVRISARLIEVESGFQMWSERFDGRMEDVFELQDRMGKRIAEALRVELESITHHGLVPAEAIDLYMRAKQAMRDVKLADPDGAVALYEQCLELAPKFKPAFAAHALACLRTWFVPGHEASRDWEAESHRAVELALDEAGELAATQLAAATMAVQVGEYTAAARFLAKTLKIAPTYAAAQEYLGRLQLEAGRGEEGLRRLQLAVELDPTLSAAHVEIARYYACRGEYQDYEKALAELKRYEPEDMPIVLALEIRVAGYREDMDLVRICLERNEGKKVAAVSYFVELLGRAMLGELDDEALALAFETATTSAINPRFLSMVLQLVAEVHAIRGRRQEALACITRAADGVLVDLEWLDHCPALQTLREEPAFAAARREVRRRAEAIWKL